MIQTRIASTDNISNLEFSDFELPLNAPTVISNSCNFLNLDPDKNVVKKLTITCEK